MNQNLGYQRILERLKDLNPAQRIFGLTATPWRIGMGHLTAGKTFETVAHEIKITDLIERGFLVPLKGYAPTAGQIHTTGLRAQNSNVLTISDVERTRFGRARNTFGCRDKRY